MRFGPSELFWTAIFGITVITGLSSGAMLKGLFGDLPARSGDDADDGADEAADAQRAQVAPMCLDHLPQHTLLWLEGQLFEEDVGFGHEIDDLRHGEKADERGHKAMPPLSASWMTKRGSPVSAVADGREEHPERPAEETLEHGPGRQTRDDRDAENGRPEEFRGAEAHGEFRHRWREQDHHQHAEHAADEQLTKTV